MSENFETGLNELYTRAAAAHADGSGFPTTTMVAVARRNRRARTAAVALTTAAAVVGVGLGGAAAVRNLGDGDGAAPPAASPDSTSTAAESYLALECGSSVADLAFDRSAVIGVVLDQDTVPIGGSLDAQVTMAVVDPPDSTVDVMALAGIQYVAVQGGIVVGTGDDTVDLGTATQLSGRQGVTAPTAIDLTRCDDGTVLAAGSYQLYAQAVLARDEGQGEPFVVGGGPWDFRVEGDGDPAPTPGATTPPTDITHQTSALFTDGEPLADGDYIASVSAIDASARTIEADLMVWYGGAAAEEYVAANIPGGEVMNDYYLANDVEQATTLPLDPDVTVYEWCFGDGDTPDLTHLARTVPEWASAPHYDGVEAHLDCAAGQLLDRGDLYWLRVRDGVVTAVTGQFVP